MQEPEIPGVGFGRTDQYQVCPLLFFLLFVILCHATNVKAEKVDYWFLLSVDSCNSSPSPPLCPAPPNIIVLLNRPYWRCYYSNTDAIIYVVDSSDRDRMGISKSELVAMLEVKTG